MLVEEIQVQDNKGGQKKEATRGPKNSRFSEQWKQVICRVQVIKVCDSYSWSCPGTSTISSACPTVSSYLCNSGRHWRFELKASSNLKQPFKGRGPRLGNYREKHRGKVFLDGQVSHLFAHHPGKSMIFDLSGSSNVLLLAPSLDETKGCAVRVYWAARMSVIKHVNSCYLHWLVHLSGEMTPFLTA